MVDLGGYVIVLVKKDDKIKIFGSAAEKDDCDEIQEINGVVLENATHDQIIDHIYHCIKTRTICLRVKRRTSNKLEASIDSSLIDAFVIGSKAREHLQVLTKDSNITPKDIALLSKTLCYNFNSGIKDFNQINDENKENFEILEKKSSLKDSKISDKNDLTDFNYLELNDDNMHILNLKSDIESFSVKSNSQQSIVDLVKKSATKSLNNTSLNKIVYSYQKSNFQKNIDKDEVKKTIPFEKLDSIVSNLESLGDKDLKILLKKTNFKKLVNIYSFLMLENYMGSIKSKLDLTEFNKKIINSIESNKQLKEELVELLKILSNVEFENLLKVLKYIYSNRNDIYKEKDLECESYSKKVKISQNEIICNEENIDSETTSKFQEPPPIPPLPTEVENFLLNSYNTSVLTSTLINKISSIPSNSKLSSSTNPKVCIQNIIYSDNPCNQLNHESNVQKSDTPSNSDDVVEQARNEKISNESFLETQSNEIQSNFNNLNLPAENEITNGKNLLDKECLVENFTVDTPCTINNFEESSHLEKKVSNQISNLQIITNTPDSNLDNSSENMLQSLLNNSAKMSTNFEKISESLPPNTKLSIVRIEKHSAEPLGATVKNESDGRVTIGRIICGGAAEKCAALQEGDEILMVNNVCIRGKNVDQVCELLSQMQGTLIFVIAKCNFHDDSFFNNSETQNNSSLIKTIENFKLAPENISEVNINHNHNITHYKAFFDYNPNEDIYIPCRELGVTFKKGDLLHVIDSSDECWWQAYKEGDINQNLAGLIPSLKFQLMREEANKKMNQTVETDFDEQNKLDCPEPGSFKKSSSILFNCGKKSTLKKKRIRKEDFLKFDFFLPYEKMKQCVVNKRTIVLVGPNNIGRQNLRERLLKHNSLCGTAIPHTSRSKRSDERNEEDYYFVTKQQFEQLIEEEKLLEFGYYEKNYYGTTFDAIEDVLQKKSCILNLHIDSVFKLKTSKTGKKFRPFFVLIDPPTNIEDLKKLIESVSNIAVTRAELHSIVDEAWDLKNNFSHLFDLILTVNNLDETYNILLNEIKTMETEPQWLPESWF